MHHQRGIAAAAALPHRNALDLNARYYNGITCVLSRMACASRPAAQMFSSRNQSVSRVITRVAYDASRTLHARNDAPSYLDRLH